MGHVIELDARRTRWTAPGGRRPRVDCVFDVGSPWTYLAAERIDRHFAGVRWRPALAEAMPGGARHDDVTRPPLPPPLPAPERTGSHSVQLLRTYPYRRTGYPFAPQGERSLGIGVRVSAAGGPVRVGDEVRVA